MTPPGSADSRALLIGVGEYTRAELPNVPQVRATVQDLKVAISDPQVGAFLPEHCRIMQDERDQPAVGRVLHQMADEAHDTLLVYYTGHGVIDESTFELYLALPDTEAKPQFSALKYADVRDAVHASSARTKIIILDCCFSGRATNQALSDEDTVIRGQLDVDGAAVLTSAPENQAALVLPGEQYTAFTGRLITLLREGLPDGPKEITVEFAFRELKRLAKEDGLPQPRMLAKQNAVHASLARNRALLAELSEPVVPALAEFAARWRRPSALLDRLRSACGAAAGRLDAAMPDNTYDVFAPSLGDFGLRVRDAAFALVFGVAWLLAALTRVFWCALSVLRDRNQTAFTVVLGLATVCAAVSVGAVFSSSAPASAATCSYTQTVSATDASNVTVTLATATAGYEAVFRTSAGQFTLKALSADHPCAAYALRYLIEHGYYNGQQCAYFDGTSSGYVLDCFDPESPPSSTGVSFTADTTNVPSTSNGLVLMWVNADGQAGGILAFSGNDPAPTENSYEPCAQIITGTGVLAGIVNAGYHTGLLGYHTFANKPFTIESVTLLQPHAPTGLSTSPATPHS